MVLQRIFTGSECEGEMRSKNIVFNKMRRFLWLAALLPGLLICCLLLGRTASAEDRTCTINGVTFIYTTSSTGTNCKIREIQTNGRSTVTIPDKINGSIVKQLALRSSYWEGETQEYLKVRKFISKSRWFKSKDGVLYSRDMFSLVLYPAGRDGTSFTVPDGVAVLDDGAFMGSRLSEIILPRSLLNIGFGVFKNCTNLTELNLPNQVSSILLGAFSGCTSLTSLFIPPKTSMGWTESGTGISGFRKGYDDLGLTNNTTIKGVSGSDAQGLAEYFGFPFEETDYSLYPAPFEVLKKRNIGIGEETLFTVRSPVRWDYTVNDTKMAVTDWTNLISYQKGNTRKDYGYAKGWKGMLKGVRCGKVKITLTSKADLVYAASTRTMTFKVVPSQPTLKVRSRSHAAKLTWTKSKGASQYLVYVQYPGKRKFKLALTKSSRVKSVTHKGLASGKRYSYKVRSRKKVNGEWYYSAYSQKVSVKVK